MSFPDREWPRGRGKRVRTIDEHFAGLTEGIYSANGVGPMVGAKTGAAAAE